MLYHVMHKACADEMGDELFEIFGTTHQFQRAQRRLINDSASVWWDDIRTPVVETRDSIFWYAFEKSFDELREQFGDNPKIWRWGKACKLELKHPLGEVALFRPFYNIGPYEVSGGNETIRQSGFYHDSTGVYKVHFGSQMRIMVDFAHADSAWNITPAGQSGHLLSPHYSDQTALYNNGEFRVMSMAPEVYSANEVLRLVPKTQ
jgi:penicillin amidase